MKILRVPKLLVIITLIVVSLFCCSVHSSVIGIDFGLDWFKVSIVKPGIPLDVVLNKETKRKTTSLVLINKGEVRLFGNDAISKSTRFPHLSYPALKNLLGQKYDGDIAQLYRENFGNKMIKRSDGTCAFENESQEYCVPHLVALVLQHAKNQAIKHGEEQVYGAVLTVPPYFNHFERQALLDAANLTGLRVLSLLNDETAVALNYAMLRKFTNEDVYHVFYDMGAGSTVASLVTFKNVNVTETKYKKPTTRSVPEVSVQAVGYDPLLGGKSFDQRVVNILKRKFLEKFVEKHSQEEAVAFENNSRAAAKLLKEANRVKQILSANTATFASIEGLYDDIDFKAEVTREEFEAECTDLFEKIAEPIKKVLNDSGHKAAEIESLVLVGGGIRIPKIQEILGDLIGKEKIARNVNGDEAAVLGAGFRAASLSTQFKVKEISVKDKNMYPAEVQYPLTDGAELTKTLVYSDSVNFGTKKIMNFKRLDDFEFKLTYRDSGDDILGVRVTGAEKVVADLKEKKRDFIKGPVIKALLNLDDSGLYSVEEVYVHAELGKSMTESITDGIMSFFGKGEEKPVPEGEEVTDEDKDAPATGEDKKDKKDSKSNKKASKKDDKKEEEQKNVIEKVPLNFTVVMLTQAPISDTEKSSIKLRIAAMDKMDEQKRLLDETRNSFETLIYQVKYAVEDDDVIAVTTSEQRTALEEKATASQLWFEDNFDSDIETLKKEHQLLDTEWKPVVQRRYELANRDGAIQDLGKYVNVTEFIVSEAKKNQTEIPKDVKMWMLYDDAEIASTEKFLVETKEWLDTKSKEQGELENSDEPILKVADLERKKLAIERRFSKLLKSKKWTKVNEEIKETAEGEKPAEDGEEPVKEGEKPAEDGEEPAKEGEKPAEDGEEPAKEGEEPVADETKVEDQEDLPVDDDQADDNTEIPVGTPETDEDKQPPVSTDGDEDKPHDEL